MKTCKVVIEDSGRTLADAAGVALTARERARGLLGRRELPPGEGLLIRHCRSVHTFFMHFPIDLVYLSADNVVVRIVEGLKPFRLSACLGARSVLELPAGWAQNMGLRVGHKLRFE